MSAALDKETINKIRQLRAGSVSAAKFFSWAAQRVNDAFETTVDRVVQKGDMERSEAIELLRDLAEIGCAEFVIGRRGAKSRARWKYSLKSIGKAAVGETEELVVIDPELEAEIMDRQPEMDTAEPREDSPSQMRAPAPISIAEAKEALSRSLGVSPDRIEIIIRA